MKIRRYAPAVAFGLLIGGFGILGATAGIRVSFGIGTQTLECGQYVMSESCVDFYKALNRLTMLTLVGGIVSMVSGGVSIHLLRRHA